ncbi:hypothetical protein [Pseudomonas sp. MWU16-30322]|jgi:archaellum component FlaG (FlaF/FlaG flagellin family)|uniref:hypothetical protein n=1 Tax=Pseudomonas sp. MWU16-30322 TaxID=2878092 RepID=UPI001CFA2BDE|nr:hypothetical protein [Pseudomonas sp. MWU16-30322]
MIKFYTLEDYVEFFAPLYDSITEIATRHGYKKSGNTLKDYNDDCLILLEDYAVHLAADVPLIVVKEIGLAVRKFKNKDVTLLCDGSFVTHKQIKMLVEMEKQTA